MIAPPYSKLKLSYSAHCDICKWLWNIKKKEIATNIFLTYFVQFLSSVPLPCIYIYRLNPSFKVEMRHEKENSNPDELKTSTLSRSDKEPLSIQCQKGRNVMPKPTLIILLTIWSIELATNLHGLMANEPNLKKKPLNDEDLSFVLSI